MELSRKFGSMDAYTVMENELRRDAEALQAGSLKRVAAWARTTGGRQKERMIQKRNDDRQLLLNWYEQMTLCFERELTSEEREDLARWDREWVDGGAGIGTSDWPGWEKHIGPRPAASAKLDRRRTA